MARWTQDSIFFFVILLSLANGLPAPSGLITIGDMILTSEQHHDLYGAGDGGGDGAGNGDGDGAGGKDGDGAGDGAGELSESNLLAISPGMRDKRYLWPNKKVFYHFENVKYSVKTRVRQTLKQLTKKLDWCIEFEEKKDMEQGVIKIIPRKKNCSSTLGYSSYMRMKFSTRCYGPEIEHEFLHSLGVQHTQTRSDRDNYVTIKWGNIEEEEYSNFRKVNSDVWSNYGLPYDYRSVMHYRGTDFAKNGRRLTIKTKDPRMQNVIGRADGVSDLDIQLVKKMYDC
eukprot:GFUD01034175.1.p1 GENE.GFUD01034175.1~~GFUD01034175.1.p1  ORF type:complete len:301 (+),score=46.39 GFUD01034175.1:53-904(+)